MIVVTPTINVKFDKSGQHINYDDQKGYEALWRKHQTSTFAHDVWIYDAQTGDHTQLTPYPGEDRNPVWPPDEHSTYYLSDQIDPFNPWHRPSYRSRYAPPQQ